MVNDYFHRASTKWNLLEFCHHFLETAPEPQRTMSALSTAWINSLNAIRNEEGGEEPRRARKAQLLLGQWEEQAGKKTAKAAIDAHRLKPNMVNNSTFLGEVGTVFSGSVGVVELEGSGGKGESSEGSRRKRSDDEVLLRKKKKKKLDVTNDWRKRFLDMYHSMDPSKKMKLSTGIVVEDVIFSYASQLEKPALVHAFVIDTDNLALRDEFEDVEWREIQALVDARQQRLNEAEKPKCLQWVPNSVTTTLDLRNILYGSEQPQGLDEEWVADVYRQFLFLLEHPDKPLTRPQCENWFEVTIFGRLVNRCIMALPSVEVHCKESMSVATRSYLNKNRAQTGEGNHLLPSPRLDAIFRVQSGYELGGCEVSGHDGGEEDTKRIDDYNKLVPILSHMLRGLHAGVKVQKPEKIEVVGLLCSGLTIQSLRMHSPNGYTCFLLKDTKLRIPSNPRRIRDVRKLLESMWLVKKTINDTVELLWSEGDSGDDENDQDEGIK